MDTGKTKILVVDDLPEKLLVYQVVLEELGQEVVAAHSGTEALRQVLQHDFAVILLDVNMPDMDGFETAALIRQRRRSAHTPIIFITSFADELRAAQGYAHGAVDYILAPVVPEILRAKVKVFVDLFSMTEQVKRQAEERIALAEERSKRAAVEESNRRLSFGARAGAVLGQSLDYQVTARDLVKLTIPVLADRALLAQMDPTLGGDWAVIQAIDTVSEPAVQELRGLDLLSLREAAAIELALASGMRQELPAHDGGRDGDPETLVLPLRARGQSFAVLLVSREPSGRLFGPADMTMAESLSSRAAVALDNARLYKDIEHADQQKNEFLSMLAHELRNPLAPIRNAVAVLRMQEESKPDVRWAQDVIDRQVTHLVRLVDDLLDISRITRGKIRLEYECVDVSVVVSSAVETSRPLIEAGRHRLFVQLPADPIHVHADQARLSQVLANLLNNAAKYTPSGGSIWLSVRPEDGQAVFRIRDTGMGIPREMLGRVFDLFTQIDQSLDRSQGGLGIGLTLVKRLVELHGGSVQAASDGPTKGSEFTVRIPATKVPGTVPVGRAGAQHLPRPRERCRVLVVDDNVDSADSLAKLLRLEGHQIRTAYDGPSALDLARSFLPQAAILDLGLPGLSGYEIASLLRDDPETRRMILIAVSGYGREEDYRHSKQAGFNHHFTKPVNFTTLLEVLASPRGDEPVIVPMSHSA